MSGRRRRAGGWALGSALVVVGCSEPAAPEAGAAQGSPAAAGATKDAAQGVKAAEPELDEASLPGSIYFVSERDGNLEAYRWRAGAGPERLTDDPGSDFVAEIDPKGSGWTRVVTLDGDSPEAHRERLWWMPTEGEPVAIGVEGRRARGPSWAPDRSFVVFESSAEGAFSDVWRWSRDDGALSRLTRTEHGAFEPAVSPDGRSIAYVSTHDGNPELYLMGADGSEPRRLTEWRRDDMAPRWSPDGKRLAFLRREQGGERLFVLELHEGGRVSEQRLLPTEPGEQVIHADHGWSPDGRHLVLTEHRPRQAPRVVTVELESRSPRPLSPASLRATMPSWSPDGRFVAFAGTEEDPDALDLYVASVADGRTARLTTHQASDWLPRWVD